MVESDPEGQDRSQTSHPLQTGVDHMATAHADMNQTLQAGAHAVEEVAKTARVAPRFAIVTMAFVMCFGLVLAFVYLMSSRPSPDNPMPTAGNWMTVDQFQKALTAYGLELTPATNAALGPIKTSIEGLRTEIDRRFKENGNTLERIETRLDRTLERMEKGPK